MPATPLYYYVAPIEYRGKIAPNILARISLPKETLQNRVLYHDYQIEDGDRPDTIAAHYYGDEFRDWLVLLSNQIINPRAEWPLTNIQFNEAIIAKYDSIEEAMSQVAYYKVNPDYGVLNQSAFDALPEASKRYFTRTASVSGQASYGISSLGYRINADSFSILPEAEKAFWIAVSVYEDELEQNEAKRSIKLIDSSYVPQLETQLRKVSKNVS